MATIYEEHERVLTVAVTNFSKYLPLGHYGEYERVLVVKVTNFSMYLSVGNYGEHEKKIFRPNFFSINLLTFKKKNLLKRELLTLVSICLLATIESMKGYWQKELLTLLNE